MVCNDWEKAATTKANRQCRKNHRSTQKDVEKNIHENVEKKKEQKRNYYSTMRQEDGEKNEERFK